MYIVSRDGLQVINMDNVTSIYAGSDGYTVKASFVDGSGCQIGRYGRPVAGRVVRMLAESLGKTEAYFLPGDGEVEARINAEAVKLQRIGGKKPKSHGGS